MLRQHGHSYFKLSELPRPPHINLHKLFYAFKRGGSKAARALRATAAGGPPGTLDAHLFRWVGDVNGALLAAWRRIQSGKGTEQDHALVDVEAARKAEAKAAPGSPPLVSVGVGL